MLIFSKGQKRKSWTFSASMDYGYTMWHVGRGSDVIGEEWDAKSISREETFAKDIADKKELEKFIFALTEDVCQQLRANGWKTRTVTLKLRYSDFKTITHAQSIEPTNDDTIVSRTARSLLHSAYTRKLPIRLIGVRLTNFDDEEQMELSPLPF